MIANVPVGAVTRKHCLGQAVMNSLCLAILSTLLDFYHIGTSIYQWLEERFDCVVDLCFDSEECRVVGGEGVGPEDDGEIGKVMDICAEVRLCATALIPLVVQGRTVYADDVHRCEELSNLESCREHNNVVVVGYTTRADNSSLCDLLDSMVQQLDIGSVEAVEVVWVENTPFAAERKVGYDKIPILLRRARIDVLFRFFFGGDSGFDTARRREVSCRLLVSIQEYQQPQ